MRKHILNLGYSFLSILRVLRHSHFRVKKASTDLASNSCLILGNGPSLKVDLEILKDSNRLPDIWCVNFFADSVDFERLKPKFYVFADPDFWSIESSGQLIANREKLFLSIAKKTSWPLTIFVPYISKRYFENIFRGLPNISLSFFNHVTASGIKQIVNFFYDMELAIPHAQNVLVLVLFLSIRRGYKNIFLLGADHSWHETLVLDKDNRVCFRDRHFNDDNDELTPFYTGGQEKDTFTMSQSFKAFSLMFEGYWEVRRYAERMSAQVYNASLVSYIDAFKRISCADLLDIDFRVNDR